jgi:hypothetical protein
MQEHGLPGFFFTFCSPFEGKVASKEQEQKSKSYQSIQDLLLKVGFTFWKVFLLKGTYGQKTKQ